MEIEEEILEPVINNDYPSNIDNISDILSEKSFNEEIKKIDTIIEETDESLSIKPISTPVTQTLDKNIEEIIELESQIEPVEEQIDLVKDPIEEHIESVCEPIKEQIEQVESVCEQVCEQIEPIESVEPIEEQIEQVELVYEPVEEHIEPVESVELVYEPVEPVCEQVCEPVEPVKEQIEPVESVEEQIKPVCEPIKIVSIEELTEEILPLEDKEIKLVCTPIVQLKDVAENVIQLLPLEKTIVDKLIKSLESNKIQNELMLIVSLMELIEVEKTLNKTNSYINILNYMYSLIEKDNRVDLIVLVKLVELKDKMNVNSFAKIVCDSSKGKLNINKKKNWLCNLLKF